MNLSKIYQCFEVFTKEEVFRGDFKKLEFLLDELVGFSHEPEIETINSIATPIESAWSFAPKLAFYDNSDDDYRKSARIFNTFFMEILKSLMCQ